MLDDNSNTDPHSDPSIDTQPPYTHAYQQHQQALLSYQGLGPAGHGHGQQAQHMQYQQPQHKQQDEASQQRHLDAAGQSFDGLNPIIDPNDPMLDADPFGLSASMHFPTSYSFEHPPQR